MNTPKTHAEAEQISALTSQARAARIIEREMDPLRQRMNEIAAEKRELQRKLAACEGREAAAANELATHFTRKEILATGSASDNENYIEEYIRTRAIEITTRMAETLQLPPLNSRRDNELKMQCSKPELVAALLDSDISSQLKVSRDAILRALIAGLTLLLTPKAIDEKVAEAIKLGLLADNDATKRSLEKLKGELTAIMDEMRRSFTRK